MATGPSDDSNFPSTMNIQDLLDMSNAIPEECASNLPTAPGTMSADVDKTPTNHIIQYEGKLDNKIADLLESSALSDVTFLLGEERVEIKSHKLVLALSSPVFQVMFYGEMTSSNPENEKSSSLIEIPDCTPHAFQALLQFIYKGVQPSLTVDEALSVLYASRKYAIRGLEDMCCLVLSSSMASDNVFDILYAATFYSLPALDFQCWEFMEDNAVQVLNAHLEYMTHETIRSLLKNDKLNASESDLFKVVISWAELECAKQELPKTPENLREMCAEELKMVRFPTMTGQEFADVVVPTKILTMDQVCKIFTMINASADKKGENDTEFSETKRTPKAATKTPEVTRTPVFSFIAQQIQDDRAGNEVEQSNYGGTEAAVESFFVIAPAVSLTNTQSTVRNRNRQSRRSRRRNNNTNNPPVGH